MCVELPPKDGSTDGSPITAVSQWGQRLLVCRLGLCSARMESLIGGRSDCDCVIRSVSCQRLFGSSGERAVVLVIE